MNVLNSYIDHTLLAPNATEKDIDKIVAEAKQYKFHSVCVNSCWVRHVSQLLKDTNIKTVTVIGFPFGACSTTAKVEEAKKAMLDGADECDMVQNIGWLLSGKRSEVQRDEEAVINAVHVLGGKVKVILENCYLTIEQIADSSKIAEKAGADFIKTSTGFGPSGARAQDVRVMFEATDGQIGIKAAGGIHTKAEAELMLNSGATRLGTSSSLKIIKE